MVQFVKSEQNITDNVLTIRKYRDGSDGDKEFHNDLIKRGRLFVVGRYENEFAFAPSRLCRIPCKHAA